MGRLRAFTVRQGEKPGEALRFFLLAALHHEDIRRIRRGMLWALCVAGLPVWACARWPESLGKEVVNALLGLWLVGFLCLVLVFGLERWWSREAERCLSRLCPPPEAGAKEDGDG